jgi:hypothetical protein
LLCSLGSISVGFYFRQHYFITLLPVMALLTGLAVSRAIRLVKHDTTIELFVALPIFLLFGLGCLISLGGNGPTWFAMTPVEVVENTYHTTLFTEARKLAEYIRTNAEDPNKHRTFQSSNVPSFQHSNIPSSSPSAYSAYSAVSPSIAVLGSEPEIYFYSRRRSATGYIYMYPLMETHPYAAQMQQELINEIEAGKPQGEAVGTTSTSSPSNNTSAVRTTSTSSPSNNTSAVRTTFTSSPSNNPSFQSSNLPPSVDETSGIPYSAFRTPHSVDYIVYVDYRFSWLGRPESSRVFDHWWQNYSTNLELLQSIEVKPPPDVALPDNPEDAASIRGHLLLYRKR